MSIVSGREKVEQIATLARKSQRPSGLSIPTGGGGVCASQIGKSDLVLNQSQPAVKGPSLKDVEGIVEHSNSIRSVWERLGLTCSVENSVLTPSCRAEQPCQCLGR